MVQLMSPAVLGTGKDLELRQRGQARRSHQTYLVAAREFASMHTLPLLRFADAMRCWRVGNGALERC